MGDNEDGQLVLGGVDDRHYEGEFHFMPVATWQGLAFPTDALAFGTCLETCTVLIYQLSMVWNIRYTPFM